jgi:hypothetical protein
MNIELPARVQVAKIVSSRYEGNVRPLDWDCRKSGIDTIQTNDGKLLKLSSDGGQSPPQEGWVLVLTAGDEQAGYAWTLYGLPN